MVALWNALAQDIRAFANRLGALTDVAPIPTAGLHTYHVPLPGGSKRIHLRIGQDRTGVLFVDVTDVIHLNATAAELAYSALEGIPYSTAESRIRARTKRSDRRQALLDLQSIYGMVDRLRHEGMGCPTCQLSTLQQLPLFGAPIDAPYKADLAITYECNNDCPHCYNEPDRLSLDSLPLAQWCNVVDVLCRVGVPHLIFTGGEATLYPHLLPLIEFANSRGPICGLNTNGRRLAHAGYARQLAAAGLNHVQITLGSHEPEIHDRMMNARSFTQTVRGIESALSAGLHTITNTTLMQMNAPHIEETLSFLYRLGIRTFAVNGLIYSGGGFSTGQAISEDRLAPILIRIRDTARELGMRFLWYTPTQYCRLSPVELEIGAKRCNAGEYSLCVEPNGDVLPCQSYYVAAGNLLRDPWEQIWHSSLFRSFRDRETDPDAHGLPDMCRVCPDLPLCGGGCRIEREARDGKRTAAPGGSCAGCSSGGCGTRTSPTGSGFVAADSLLVPLHRRGSGEFRPAGAHGDLTCT